MSRTFSGQSLSYGGPEVHLFSTDHKYFHQTTTFFYNIVSFSTNPNNFYQTTTFFYNIETFFYKLQLFSTLLQLFSTVLKLFSTIHNFFYKPQLLLYNIESFLYIIRTFSTNCNLFPKEQQLFLHFWKSFFHKSQLFSGIWQLFSTAGMSVPLVWIKEKKCYFISLPHMSRDWQMQTGEGNDAKQLCKMPYRTLKIVLQLHHITTKSR